MHLPNVNTDLDTGEVHISDRRVYAVKRSDPDMPSFSKSVIEQYIEAMQKEISALIHQNTWIMVPHSEADNVIKSTWDFKLKRLPEGTPSKFKARFCVRGDLHKDVIEYLETYAHVVTWLT